MRWKEWLAAAVALASFCGSGGCSGVSNGTDPAASPVVQTAGIDGTVSDAVLSDIKDVEFASNTAALNLSGTSSTDRFILAVQATSPTPADYNVQIAEAGQASLNSPVALSLDEEAPEAATEQFHEYLREMEGFIRESGDFEEVRAPQATHLATQQAVGSQKQFRVLSSINSITQHSTVTATLRLVSDHLYIYVDDEASSHLNETDVANLAHDFEEIALPLERSLIGRESDINSDGRIAILMTPVLNRMASSGGIVTGFFFPGDLYHQSAVSNPASNEQEIFYTMVPDADGRFGTPISETFTIENILPGVLAHEYQHMASFNRHVLVSGGSTESPWLNECLSHFFEDLTGFGNENPSRVRLYLAQTGRTALIPSTSPSLSERGGCYLFLRYLYEQSGDGDRFLQRLYENNLTSVANLEAAFDGGDSNFDDFADFLKRWAVALTLSETGLSSDPKYNYQTRAQHPETGNKTGVCIRCEAQDGRGTVLGGPLMNDVSAFPISSSIKATAIQFYQFEGPANHITISGTNGSNLTGTLIRLQSR